MKELLADFGKVTKELLAVDDDYPYRRETVCHLSKLQVNLQMRQNRSKDLREVIMNLAPAYEQWYAKTIEQGKQEGLTEGKQIGLTEGKQIGITEGKQETARRMLSRNMPLEEISDLTDLSIAQLQALQTKNQ
jgi:predicted transposase/invertase (TIGR01784 family)